MAGRGRRNDRQLSEFAAFVPVLAAPLAWWIGIRAWRRARSERDPGGVRRRLGQRLVGLAAFDTVLAAMVAAAWWRAPPGSLDPVATRSPEASSPFEPMPWIDCGDLWRDQLFWMLWPVAVGCSLITAVWLRGRTHAPPRPGRWGTVLLPLLLSPIAGIGASSLGCASFGGWSAGVGWLGVIAQHALMVLLGVGAMRFARAELGVVVGPRLPAARATGTAALAMIAGVARLALLAGALLSLLPGLHDASNAPLTSVLVGDGGIEERLLFLGAAVVIAPVAEEVVFRGLLLPGFAQSMGTTKALVLSSAVFALFHVPSHGSAAVLPGVLGFAFGWARLRTGGLRAPIALHIANNLVVTLLSWAAA